MIKSKKRDNKNSRKNGYALFYDIIIIAGGIAVATLIVKTGIMGTVVDAVKDYYILSSFIAGIFFTSAFTISLSSVALVGIAEHSPIGGVVLFGALGAMCGDLILFFFIKDKFTEDLKNSIKPKTLRHILHSFHFGFLKWLSPIIGALIIASPLPDELGITLLGMSKMKLIILIPITLTMNMLGIYALISFSHLI